MSRPLQGLFVTGTDTDAGKTVVAAGIVHALAATGLRVAVMKPVASGARETPAGLRNEDAERLLAASKVAADYDLVNPYCFVPPIAPHLAAEEAGVTIDRERIEKAARALAARADALIVEGVGGWRVPLAPNFDVAALAGALGLPVVLVVGLRLGCLNHALLSAAAVRSAGSPLAGWIGSGVDAQMDRRRENVATLTRLLGAPCLGVVAHLADPAPAAVAAQLDIASLVHALDAGEVSGPLRHYVGACHCGAVSVAYRTACDPSRWPLRACECGFCRAHGAVTTSDPGGGLAIAARARDLRRYRFGLHVTDFLLCAHCGTYVAALTQVSGRVYGTLNVNVMECRDRLVRTARRCRYGDEDTAVRQARRAASWTPVIGIEEK